MKRKAVIIIVAGMAVALSALAAVSAISFSRMSFVVFGASADERQSWIERAKTDRTVEIVDLFIDSKTMRPDYRAIPRREIQEYADAHGSLLVRRWIPKNVLDAALSRLFAHGYGD